MKNIFKLIAILTVFLICLGFVPMNRETEALAVRVEKLVNPRERSGSWVLDSEGILSPTTEAQINRLVNDLESETGTEIAVVTVDSIEPYSTLKEMAVELYNHWGIGKQGQDNGVLFLISVAERRMEIETGYGVEGILPDAKAGAIINQEVIPYFKESRFDEGVLAGTQALVQVLKTEEFARTSSESSVPWGLIILGGGTGTAIAAAVYNQRRRRFLPPTGESQGTYRQEKDKQFYCTNCQEAMNKITETELESKLNRPQKVAIALRSSCYSGWQCPKCSPESFHLRRYRLSWHYQFCPRCQEYTMESNTQTLKFATTYSNGLQRTTKHCHACDFHDEQDRIIPRKTRTVIVSGGGGFGGGGSSSGGFGGGSSGGGGAGGSW